MCESADGWGFGRREERRRWPWGYPFAPGLMGVLAGGLLTYFRRKKWL